MEFSKSLESETVQSLAGQLGGVEGVSEDLEEIYESDNTVYSHGEEKDVTEEAATAYASQYFDDPESVIEELEGTDYSSEEIFDVLKDDISVNIDVTRRDLLRGAAYGSTTGLFGSSLASYADDVSKNDDRLEDLNADNFEAPVGSLYGPAIAEGPLEGDPIEVYVLNFTEDGEEYDEEIVESQIEAAAAELDGLEVEAKFWEVEPTFEGFMDVNGYSRESWSEEDIREQSEFISKMRNVINNNNLLEGRVDEENRIHINGGENPTSVSRNMDWYSSAFIPENDLSPLGRLKIVSANFQEGEAGGVAYGNSEGYADMALVNDSYYESEEEFSEVVIHELGHKLGLPHTRYPDTETGQIFPDTMSYSSGRTNIPYQVFKALTGGRRFGKSSQENWEKVKQHVKETNNIEVED